MRKPKGEQVFSTSVNKGRGFAPGFHWQFAPLWRTKGPRPRLVTCGERCAGPHSRTKKWSKAGWSRRATLPCLWVGWWLLKPSWRSLVCSGSFEDKPLWGVIHGWLFGFSPSYQTEQKQQSETNQSSWKKRGACEILEAGLHTCYVCDISFVEAVNITILNCSLFL